MFSQPLAALDQFKQSFASNRLFRASSTGRSAPAGPTAGPKAGLIKEGLITAIVYADRKWRVRVWGTEWFAESVQPFAFKVGDFVQVVGRVSATTLLIDRKLS